MKSDYENLLDFCEAEVVEPKCPIATVKDRGASFEIVLHEILPAITLHKPRRAAAFDKARESFTGNDKTPYADFKAWEALAKVLGLKSDWIACTERMPQEGQRVLIARDGETVPEIAIVFRGMFLLYDSKDFVQVFPTHWQPLPIMP
jgi:hypothetical protein